MMEFAIMFLIFFPSVAAVMGYFLSAKLPRLREALFVGTTAVEFAFVGILVSDFLSAGDFGFRLPNIVGQGLGFGVDTFRLIYVAVSAFLWLITSMFSKQYMSHGEHKGRYYLFCLITLSGVMGVFLSADLFTTFCFFEIMSFASYPLVIHEENDDAMKAGRTYLAVAVISGMMLLVGIFFLNAEVGSVDFVSLRKFFAESEQMTSFAYAGGLLVLLGFGAKAGMYPLHIWLPQAHPVAPAPASALLSGILTKTGVFGIIVLCANVFAGERSFGLILLVFAVITMFLGALLALFSVNLKRTLACSSMSQIGFILVGLSFMLLLGEEGGLAQSGALLHMMNHSLIKLVLFMCAGVAAMNMHSLDLNDLKGFGRKKPFLAVVFLIGALAIMGVPLFSGYASKTMIHESIVEYMHVASLGSAENVIFKAVEWIFLCSGGLTVAYMTKLFVCLFVEKNENGIKQAEMDGMKGYVSPLSRAALAVSALPLVVIGLLPNKINGDIVSKAYEFFGVERLEESVAFFGLENLKGGLISISIGAAAYLLIVRPFMIKKGQYVNLWPSWADPERIIYFPIFRFVVWLIQYPICFVADVFEFIFIRGTVVFTLTVVRFLALFFDKIVLLLSRTALKPHVYQYKEKSFARHVGDILDKYSKKPHHPYADRLESFAEAVDTVVQREYNSFAFAFAMICLGIIVVLLCVLFI